MKNRPDTATCYIEGVRRGSNTQVYSTAVKFKIGHVSFSACFPRKIQKRIVQDRSEQRSFEILAGFRNLRRFHNFLADQNYRVLLPSTDSFDIASPVFLGHCLNLAAILKGPHVLLAEKLRPSQVDSRFSQCKTQTADFRPGVKCRLKTVDQG